MSGTFLTQRTWRLVLSTRRTAGAAGGDTQWQDSALLLAPGIGPMLLATGGVLLVRT
ncbi:hypothetical protein [Microcystis phage Mae-Yong1326-1]|nr:hypothetical protein [Microcystis phage Mae-Yong1326-1]